jgi:hypothetical protein
MLILKMKLMLWIAMRLQYLPLDAVATAVLTLTNTVTAASTHPLFLALGIEFYQEVNGTMYPLKNGSYNALSLVAVSGM